MTDVLERPTKEYFMQVLMSTALKLYGYVSYLRPTDCSVYSRYYTTTAREANIPKPVLGNGSVNTFPQQ
jgi:hypothetical protein